MSSNLKFEKGKRRSVKAYVDEISTVRDRTNLKCSVKFKDGTDRTIGLDAIKVYPTKKVSSLREVDDVKEFIEVNGLMEIENINEREKSIVLFDTEDVKNAYPNKEIESVEYTGL